MTEELPVGARWAVVFFAVSGLVDLGLTLAELPRPLAFWPVWQALGRGLLYGLLAFGLFRRLALCRSLAMVYCLASLVTYGAVLALAIAQAPFAFPPVDRPLEPRRGAFVRSSAPISAVGRGGALLPPTPAIIRGLFSLGGGQWPA
jgi:hypothetical protein